MTMYTPEFYMQKALDAAKKSGHDLPIGCVVVKNGAIVAQAANEKEKTLDVSAHAEIVAIKRACEFFGNWRLEGCEIYVTLEPCPMCAWAILNSHIDKIYFGAYDYNYGALGSKINLVNISSNKPPVTGGIKEYECEKILKDYFIQRRKENNG